MYEYRARLVRVIDGDTVELDLDLGFNVTVRETCRLYGINAPEMKGATRLDGLYARQKLSALCDTYLGQLVARTHKDKKEKYGRYLVEILGGPLRHNLNELMVLHGHAVTYLLSEEVPPSAAG